MAIRTAPYEAGELIELQFALRDLFPAVRRRDVPRIFGPVIRRRSRYSGFMHSCVRREEFERVKQEIAESRFS